MAFTSCNDFLDVKPIGKLIPEKAEDFENLLNNPSTLVSHLMNANKFSVHGMLGDNLFISENQDKFLYVNSFIMLDLYAAYTYQLPYLNPRESSHSWTWDRGIYQAANIFNTVIDGVEELDAGETENGKAIVAQAKAGRAWSYMVGGLAYGPMYNPNGGNDSKTIPYRTTSDPAIANPQLATTAELMALVKQDLDDALAAPERVINPSRANRSAVHALRAEYFMYMRDWPNMLKEATEAWETSVRLKGETDNLIYDLNQFNYIEEPNAQPVPGTDIELAFDLQGQDFFFQHTDNRENLFYRQAPEGGPSSNGMSNYYPSPDFLSLFDPQTDRRYQLFALRIEGYSTTIGDDLFEDGIMRTYCRSGKMMESEGITYPILLLTKAEAEARTGNLGNALNDLNTLRKYRYSGDDTDLPNGGSLNQDELLYEILKERRREQPLASYQRTFDIKRFAHDTGKPWSQAEIVHKIGDKTYKAPVNGEYFQIAISNAIIRHNPHWGLQEDNSVYDPAGNK